MHGTAVRVETTADRTRLLELVPQWRALAAAAGEPNIFMEPAAALAALDFPDTEAVFAILAWGTGSAGGGRLDGMLLLKPWRRSRLLPRAVQSWNYRLRAFGEPLIRGGREYAFWSAVLPELDRLRNFSVLRLAQLSGDSESTRALRAVAADLRRPLHETRRFERAMLSGPTPSADYLSRLPAKLLRELRRRRRRLAEIGEVRFSRLGAGDDPLPWIEALIDLEAGGWKGRKGVAAASEAHVAAFVRRMLADQHAAGRLDMRRLELSGRTISMLAHVVTGRTAVSFKIAFAEEFAAYSPGVLLQMEWLESGLALDWVDSCASPGHSMFDTLWLGRRPIVTLMLPFDRPVSRLCCAVENRVRRLRTRRLP